MKADVGSSFKKSFRSLFKWGDVIILALLLTAIGLTVWFAVRPKGAQAEVYVDGVLRYSLSLERDTELDILDGSMTLRVENGAVCVVRSDCSEQLCVHSAPISSEGGIIVCLPNRVVIKITGREVDAVT